MTPEQQEITAPDLLRLPLELRQQIYGYLISRETVVHPLSGVGLTSVSHRPPPLSLLLANTAITADLTAYFFGIATWKLVFCHDFNLFRTDPNLDRLEADPVLCRVRHIEIVYFCDILLLQDYPSFGLSRFCAEIKKKAVRACEVLSRAESLRTVTVSWIDTTQPDSWVEKARLLEPLRRLADWSKPNDVSFRVGDLEIPEDVDRLTFATALQNAVGPDAEVLVGGIDAEALPSRLSMLAFNVKQDVPLHPRNIQEVTALAPASPATSGTLAVS